MSRAMRAGVSLVLAALVLLQATPSVAFADARSSARRSEIASSAAPVTLLAVPSKRPVSATDPGGLDRMPPAPFAVVGEASMPCAGAPRPGVAAASGREERARALMRRQRSRSPNDPEPS
jgi:hypothetical protein